ncbi:MerR family transcriptional regulator [Gracilibacillus alcaliphilus]|uniref:MerR family transcriptional regulator n=1 Tax=Gracilibacillus alcaliphilus TaxID=1401441 RepID=UPI001958FD86|nr:MerR family transcriptional regulator [Gracilibacillus alcaliphilus]MBM7679752.1 DNA-binding transcriptional MerR regulator [Gracilibacillus alcaliphilus]
MILTTGQFERATGITQRTISYYNQIGLLSIKKYNGKRMLTDLDLIILVKIFIMKISNRRLKDIGNTNLESLSLFDLMKDLEEMNEQILHLLICLEQFENELYQRDHIINLLYYMNIFLQEYVEKH